MDEIETRLKVAEQKAIAHTICMETSTLVMAGPSKYVSRYFDLNKKLKEHQEEVKRILAQMRALV